VKARPHDLVLSVVVPCFEEEAVIAETYRRLAAAVRSIHGVRAEFVFVDDGSRDHTLEMLSAIAETDTDVRVVALSRNFGHQIALSAGLEHASGDAVAVIDADLQDPPEVLAEFVEKWRAGYDVACAVSGTAKRDSNSPPHTCFTG
jgi:dolichol-phosphate mannosyltransferase